MLDHDDHDYLEGLIDGAIWFGPWQLSFLILVGALLYWAWQSWY